ncbi:MAG TPA: hypothetical protein VD906_12705 [Caulobacteraceae bacterium]|nr:hypothetical protein [Caulobacteraceae bacterium]
MADEDRTFSPSQEQASRTRMQGNGVGQQELNAQRDPSRTPGLDQYDTEGQDNPQEDGGDPSMEAQTGANHTRRPDRTEAMRGQGPKTRAANKAEITRGGGARE